MYDFRYVTKKEAAPVKETLIEIIHKVQDLVRKDFTFQFTFIGSSSRNMITYDTKSNIGFDFDINIEVNDDDEQYTAKEIRTIIRNAIDKIAPPYGYDFCEDSTRVLTIKEKERSSARILHSCDFAIINNCEDGKQQYIRFNKDRQYYSWEYQGEGFIGLDEKINRLKEEGCWEELKKYYIDKKNRNNNSNKHSRSIFAEAINEMCQKKGYLIKG